MIPRFFATREKQRDHAVGAILQQPAEARNATFHVANGALHGADTGQGWHLLHPGTVSHTKKLGLTVALLRMHHQVRTPACGLRSGRRLGSTWTGQFLHEG